MSLITFLPSGKSIDSDHSRTVLQLAQALGLPLTAQCGGRKKCGKCKILIENIQGPTPPPSERERKVLGPLVEEGLRLACQTILSCSAHIHILPESQLHAPVILTTDSGRALHLRLQPAICPYYLEVPDPELALVRADNERFLQALKDRYRLQVTGLSLQILQKLAQTLRSPEGLTAFIHYKKEVLTLVPGKKEHCYGLAIDIGTTTLVVYLFNLVKGERISVRAGLNPQVAFGDDLISRISFSQNQSDGLETLRSTLIQTLNRLIVEAAEEGGMDTQEILEATVVGNTAMHHFFLGVDTRYLARAPFPPVLQTHQEFKARDLELGINPSGNVHLLPLKAGFVGSDTIAGILACGLHKSSDPALFMDLGTNGEIVAGWKNRMICCSTAAGPAFEGGHIRWGMRASAGAIEEVRIDPHSLQVTWRTIGKEKPIGICGSGIISALAEMIRGGIILAKGHFNKEIRTSRLRSGDDGWEFVLAWAKETAQERDIVITQKDVAEVQMAKAAVFAGSVLLLDMLAEEKIKRILLAGAFGNYVNPQDTVALGLFPEVPDAAFKVMGNTAGQGACLALLNRRKRKEAERISRKMEYLELASHPRFRESFVSGLFFRSAVDFKDEF